MLNKIDVAQFTTAQAAAACGTTAGSIAAALHRGSIVLADSETPETRNPGQGRSRLFTARRILHLALTNRLAGHGVPLVKASQMALLFTDVGGTSEDRATLIGEPTPEIRSPGELQGGETVFRVRYPLGGGEPVAEVTTRAAARLGLLTGQDADLVLDIETLHRHVMATLFGKTAS